PASRAAGTETTLVRMATSVLLLIAAIALYLARGRIVYALAAVTVLVAGTFITHATWLAAMAFIIVLNLVWIRIWYAITPSSRSDAGSDKDLQGESESAPEIIESIATAFILALIVREFWFEAFKIPTGSMEPTIYGEGYGRRKGDRLLAAKAPLLFSEPQR